MRALLERQRVADEGAGTYDAVAVAVEGTEANAQVFQVRDGVLSDRQSFYLDNQAEQDAGDRRRGVHPPVLRERAVDPVADRRPGRAGGGLRARDPRARSSPSAAAARSRSAPAERGGKRRILELAERNARLALDQEKLKAERRRQQRVDSLDGLQRALELDALPVRIECFDISHVGGTHTVASMVVFEGGAPKKSDYRRFTIREVDPGDDFGADGGGPVAPLRAVGEADRALARTTPSATRRSPRCPNLVVIDGGKGQLAAGLEPLQGFRERGVAVVSLAKRIEEVFLPGRADADRARRTTRRSCSCSSASATRRTGSRSPTTGSGATRR